MTRRSLISQPHGFDGGRKSGKSSLCSSGGDLTGCLLQAPMWQQLVLEQQRRLHQVGHLGEALIKESWSTEEHRGAEEPVFSPL